MKKTYHSDIILQYKLGLLPEYIQKQIPKSTLYNWRQRDYHHLFGLENCADLHQTFNLMKNMMEYESLLKITKTLYNLVSTYNQILNSIKQVKQVKFKNKVLIVKCIDQIQQTLSLTRAVRAFGISKQQYYAWKRNVACAQQQRLLCKKRNSQQLSGKEVSTLKQYLSNPVYQHWSITSVYYQILKDRAAFFSKSTFYKYVKILKLERPKPKKKLYPDGIRAIAPKKVLHMDVTVYRPLDHTKLYIYFLVDNFSRKILSFRISDKYKAYISFENIKEAYHTFALHKIKPCIDLITDGGPENKGAVDDFANKPNTNLRKLVAQTDIVQSNSMVEAVNKRMKYDFLFTQKLLNLEQTQKFLDWAVPQYNNKPHSGLFGLTPNEAFAGQIPDKNQYATQIKAAKLQRIEANKNQDCLNCF